MNICKSCGAALGHLDPRARYCSPRCRHREAKRRVRDRNRAAGLTGKGKARYVRRHPPRDTKARATERARPHYCAECGEPVTPGGGGPIPTYCSRTCKRRHEAATKRTRTHPCRDCGVAVALTARYCHPCRSVRVHAEQVERRPCAICGKPIRRRSKRYCSQRCWGVAEARAAGHHDADLVAMATRESRRRRNENRQRRLRAVRRERFKSSEIFERDGWVCGICGMRIDPSLRWPDQRSASVDHIVPVAKGGEDTRENVRAAHLGCNTRRAKAA